ncbi:gapN [Symbiodinium pilosum]|uniref:GapN protein n=1 Tax=Symbiodinium pilosum TaxID=2952 RepID=A0A812T1H8_SYMPI|nr:gapN [Symbiodinium pilosum]
MSSVKVQAGYQIRRSFAQAGAPVMFDPLFHARGKAATPESMADEHSSCAGAGSLAMQLFELQMPDPFRSWETLRITAKVPKEWLEVHPLPEMMGDNNIDDFW